MSIIEIRAAAASRYVNTGVRTEIHFPISERECLPVRVVPFGRSSTCGNQETYAMALRLLCLPHGFVWRTFHKPGHSLRTEDDEAMKNRLVLVAASDSSTQQHLSTVLSGWGYEPVGASSLEDALPEIAQRRFMLSLLDLGPGASELLRRLKTQGGSPGAIVVIADADSGERGVEAISLGADDFL